MPTTTIEVPVSTLPLIHHVLERERAILNLSIRNTKRKLETFERKYEMSSEEFIFIEKFERKEAGDTQDMMVWAAEYEALTNIQTQCEEIAGSLATWET